MQLIAQLKPGGRLIIPVGVERGDQYLEQIDKNTDGSLQRKRLIGVFYIPLTDKSKQAPSRFVWLITYSLPFSNLKQIYNTNFHFAVSIH